ncbi:hypothetical protein ISCGN_011698 [Ixodes scapularis]
MDTMAPKEVSPPKASGVVPLAPPSVPKEGPSQTTSSKELQRTPSSSARSSGRGRALPTPASTSSRKPGQLDEAYSTASQQSVDEMMDESMPPSDDDLVPSGTNVGGSDSTLHCQGGRIDGGTVDDRKVGGIEASCDNYYSRSTHDRKGYLRYFHFAIFPLWAGIRQPGCQQHELVDDRETFDYGQTGWKRRLQRCRAFCGDAAMQHGSSVPVSAGVRSTMSISTFGRHVTQRGKGRLRGVPPRRKSGQQTRTERSCVQTDESSTPQS